MTGRPNCIAKSCAVRISLTSHLVTAGGKSLLRVLFQREGQDSMITLPSRPRCCNSRIELSAN
eukprot:scaffold459_cov184-Amphora_coffeaeformis.AAC.1